MAPRLWLYLKYTMLQFVLHNGHCPKDSHTTQSRSLGEVKLVDFVQKARLPKPAFPNLPISLSVGHCSSAGSLFPAYFSIGALVSANYQTFLRLSIIQSTDKSFVVHQNLPMAMYNTNKVSILLVSS